MEGWPRFRFKQGSRGDVKDIGRFMGWDTEPMIGSVRVRRKGPYQEVGAEFVANSAVRIFQLVRDGEVVVEAKRHENDDWDRLTLPPDASHFKGFASVAEGVKAVEKLAEESDSPSPAAPAATPAEPSVQAAAEPVTGPVSEPKPVEAAPAGSPPTDSAPPAEPSIDQKSGKGKRRLGKETPQ